MSLCRAIHNKNFTVINNTICTDKRLSWRAKGIWLYAFSRPDDWQFYISDIVNQSTDGKDSVYSGLKELQDAGYLKRVQRRDPSGKMGTIEYEFMEIPSTDTFEPQRDLPCAVLPNTENPPLLNTDLKQNTEEQQTAAAAFEESKDFYDCLATVQIPDSDKQYLTKNFPEADVLHAIEWSQRPTTKLTGPLAAALKWAAKVKPAREVSTQEIKQQHCKEAHRIEPTIHSEFAIFAASSLHCEVCPQGNCDPICFEYGIPEFGKRLQECLVKYKFTQR